jgi:Protein of unknown function (DUF2911)
MRTSRMILAALAAVALLANPAAAQLKLPRISQKATVSQTVGLTEFTVTYSRPGVKGRTIWGGLVPYDQVWRTGANEATTFDVTRDVTINGENLAAGKYALFTIPGKDDWTIIFNKQADQWGAFKYDAKADALRLKVKPQTGDFQEWLWLGFPSASPAAADFEIRWEKLRVLLHIETDTMTRSLADARAALAAAKPDDWKTPYAAASFAFDNSLVPDEANRWIEQSLRASETPSNLYLRARMQAKAGDKAAAIRTAEAALKKVPADQKDFANEISDSIASWKK